MWLYFLLNIHRESDNNVTGSIVGRLPDMACKRSHNNRPNTTLYCFLYYDLSAMADKDKTLFKNDDLSLAREACSLSCYRTI